MPNYIIIARPWSYIYEPSRS